jgi:hypothetical protein
MQYSDLLRSPSLGQMSPETGPVGVPPLSLHCQVTITDMAVIVLSPDVGSIQLSSKRLTLTIGNHTRTSPIRSLLSSDREVKSSFRGPSSTTPASAPAPSSVSSSRRKSTTTGGPTSVSHASSATPSTTNDAASDRRREEIRARRAERQSRGRGVGSNAANEWTSGDSMNRSAANSTTERKGNDGPPPLRRAATMAPVTPSHHINIVPDDERTVEITLFYANSHMDSFDLRLLTSPSRVNKNGNVLFSVLSRHLAINLSHMSPSGSIHPLGDSAMALANTSIPLAPPSMVSTASTNSEEQLLWSQLVVVLRSDQNMVTLPIHSFDGVHFDDFVDCWLPLRELLAPPPPIVTSDTDTNGPARNTFTYQHADGFAADTPYDSYNKLRAEDSLFSDQRNGERLPNPSSSTTNTASSTMATATAAAGALVPTGIRPQRAFMQWRVAIQLSNNSVLVTPLPSLMLTYHLNQFRCRLAQPSPNQRHLLFSVGQAGREDEVDDQLQSPASTTMGGMNDAAKFMAGVDDKKDGESKALGDQLASGAHMVTLHHAKKAKAKRMKKKTVDNKESSNKDADDASATTKMNMELVLDFKLPPLRGALSLKKTIVKMIHDDDTDNDDDDGDSPSNGDSTTTDDDSKKPFKSSRRMGESKTGNDTPASTPSNRRATRARSGSDVSLRGGYERERNDNRHRSQSRSRTKNGTRKKRSDSSSGADESEDSSSGNARANSRRSKIPAGSRAVTEIEGVIAVGSMSNHIDENVLHRLLQFQSVLNQEIILIVERINRAINKSSASPSNAANSGVSAATAGGSVSAVSASPSLEPSDHHLMSPPTLVASSSMTFPPGYAADYWREMSKKQSDKKQKKAVAREHPADKFAVNIKFVLRGIELTAGLAPVHRAVLMPPSSDTVSEIGDTTGHRPTSSAGGRGSGSGTMHGINDHDSVDHDNMYQPSPPRWEPLVRVETGRFNFSVRFLPSTSPLLQGTWSATASRSRRSSVDKDDSKDTPTSGSGNRNGRRTEDTTSRYANDIDDIEDDDPLFGAPGGPKRRRGLLSDVQLEVGFTGLALSLVIPYHDTSSMGLAMYPVQVSYKTLFELESNIRIHAGCDVDLTDFSGHIAFSSTRVRVTAVPALLGSLYNFSDHYLAAFRDYTAER